MDQKRTDIESLMYRTGKLEEKYTELIHLVSGTGVDYTHLLKTKTGKYSSRAVSRMVNDLISCLEEYRSYMATTGKGYTAKMEKYKLPDEDRGFYESYFYLMLGLSTYDNTGFYTRSFKPGTWDALLERVSEPVEYLSQADLDSDLILFDIEALEKLRIPSGLFADLCSAYNIIMADDLSSLISDKERKAAYKLMTAEEIYYAKNPEKKLQDDMSSLQNANKDTDQQFWEEVAASLEKALKEEDRTGEDKLSVEDPAEDHKTSENNWAEFFADGKRFKESCMAVRSGIPDKTRKYGSFRNGIKNAVYLYLWKNNISLICDDDSFYTVYAYLNKARTFAAHDILNNRMTDR